MKKLITLLSAGIIFTSGLCVGSYFSINVWRYIGNIEMKRAIVNYLGYRSEVHGNAMHKSADRNDFTSFFSDFMKSRTLSEETSNLNLMTPKEILEGYVSPNEDISSLSDGSKPL